MVFNNPIINLMIINKHNKWKLMKKDRKLLKIKKKMVNQYPFIVLYIKIKILKKFFILKWLMIVKWAYIKK